MTRSQSIVLTLLIIGVAIALHIISIDYYTLTGVGRALGTSEGQAIAEMLKEQGVKGALPVVITSFSTGDDQELALVAGMGMSRVVAALLGLVAPPVLLVSAYFIELGSHAKRKKARAAAQAPASPEAGAATTPLKRRKWSVGTIAVVAVCVLILLWAIWMLLGMNPN